MIPEQEFIQRAKIAISNQINNIFKYSFQMQVTLETVISLNLLNFVLFSIISKL